MPTTDETLERLAKELRRLIMEYTQYFGGARALPPTDTEWRAEQLLKHCSERSPEMTSAQRFRFNNLAMSHAKYQEMWRKRLKQREASGARARAKPLH